MTQTAKLTASDAWTLDFFGWSVSVSNETIIVGANRADYFRGSAYVFEKGAAWQNGSLNQTAKLIANDRAEGDYFAYSVSVSGDTVVVGARGDESYQGSAYIFEKNAGWLDGSGNQTARLTASDGAGSDVFGSSVSVSGDTVVVGAEGDDIRGNADQGSAYVFEKGAGWSDGSGNQAAKLMVNDGTAHDWCGCSVSVSGDVVIVGAERDDIGGYADQGSAYLFEKGAGWTDGSGNQTARLTASDGAEDDRFGCSVSVGGGAVIVGAKNDTIAANGYQGSVYVFNYVESIPTLTQWGTIILAGLLLLSSIAVIRRRRS